MLAQKSVLVYGKSLNLAGIVACLKGDADLDVHFIDPYQLNTREVLKNLEPETVIYDLTDPPADLDISLLGERPGLLLVGVDPSSNEVLVLTGKRNRVVTASELTHLVSHHKAQIFEEQEHLPGDKGVAIGTTQEEL
jgi:hypothetical protein